MAFKHLADDEENEYHQSGCLQGERFSRVDREFDQKPGADVPKAKTRKVISHPETKVAPENVTQGCSRAGLTQYRGPWTSELLLEFSHSRGF